MRFMSAALTRRRGLAIIQVKVDLKGEPLEPIEVARMAVDVASERRYKQLAPAPPADALVGYSDWDIAYASCWISPISLTSPRR